MLKSITAINCNTTIKIILEEILMAVMYLTLIVYLVLMIGIGFTVERKHQMFQSLFLEEEQ